MGNVADAVDFYIKCIQDNKLIQSVTISNVMRDMNRALSTRFVSISQQKDTCKYASDEDIILIIKIKSDKKVPDCRINCTIFSSMDVPVCCNSSFDVFCIDVGEEKTIEYTIHNPGLAAGKYSISFSVGVGNMSTGETNFDVVQKVIRFEIDRVSKDTDLQFVKWNTSAWGSIYLKSSLKCID